MNYRESLDYIHSISWCFCKPGLERTQKLCRALGDPQKKLRFIHVAGTNGKGSTCAMLASVLKASGYRVGLFTSPFILRFNERMQVNGVPIGDEELAALTTRIRPIVEDAFSGGDERPTEFELITAVSLLWFAERGCDVVVFEVGMGGRLDSTNIIDADTVAASVITGIAMDHTAYLGDTPEKIAAEKAGIIKPGVPVIFGGAHAPVGQSALSAVDTDAVGRVIARRAAEVGAPYLAVDDTGLANVRSGLYGSDFDFFDRVGLHIPLAGLYQPYNAATALTVIDILRTRGFSIPEDAIRSGLSTVSWPGRFEILCRDPLVISDGGHNPEGIDAAVESVKAYFGARKIYLLTGVMADKDYVGMAARMGEVASRVFAVRPDDGHGRALDPQKYAAVFTSLGIRADGYDSLPAALAAALAACRTDDTPLLCLGSLYMYGQIREAIHTV